MAFCPPQDQKVLATMTEQANANDELLDAKEASRRLGYSVRWLYKERRFPTIHDSRKDGQAALLQAGPWTSISETTGNLPEGTKVHTNAQCVPPTQ